MGSRVSVEVEIERNGRRVAAVAEMDSWIVEDAIQHIDLPDGTADSFSRYLCTDVVTIQRTMKARKIIADQLTKAIVEALGAKDTEMGYPK